MNENKRVIWIDNVKVIAMILVVLCHFSQSMAEASIVAKSAGLVFLMNFAIFFIFSFSLFARISFFKNTQAILRSAIMRKTYQKSWLRSVFHIFSLSLLSHLFKTLFSSYVKKSIGQSVKRTFRFTDAALLVFICFIFDILNHTNR